MCLLVATTLVGATLISYFGKVETTMNVAQSVQIDGKDWNEPITYDLSDAQAGCCYCYEHTVTNNACEPIELVFNHVGVPNLAGIDVSYKQKCYLDRLEVNVLDGQAQYDNFDVYVGGILVYSYSALGGAETWILHTIDLTSYQIPCFGTHTIKIDCTAISPWGSWATYGQLGVDTIALYCGEICDSVDIGKLTSEAGHNLQSWGTIEPAASGGNWGGIDDCRATWTSTDNSRSATVDLTCEFCECDCDKPNLDMPFTLQPDETLEFCICYDLDVLLAPGAYTVTHKLVPNQ